MKRVIAWVLILTLCLGLFAGCKKDKDEQTPTGDATSNVADLEAALEYVKTVYKKPSEKTPKDFQRIGNVPVNGKDYEVVWSADVGEEYIKVVKGTDGMVTIDVNENVTEDVKYVLTATISDDAGNSVSHGWNHILPAATNLDMVAIVEEAYKLESGASMDYEVTLTGVITAINTPWDAGYKNITVTIKVAGAEDKPIQCYRLSGDGAENLKIGDTITVTGTLKNYNGTIEFDAGCTLDAVVPGEAVEAPDDMKKIVDEAYDLGANESLPYEATLTGTITQVGTAYDSNYGNITVTIVVEGRENKPIVCYRMKGDGVDKIGVNDIITVKGYITNYVGEKGHSTIEFTAGCQLLKWEDKAAPKAPTDPKVIVDAAYALGANESLKYEATLTGKITKVGTAYDSAYGNITVTMVVEGRETKPIVCYRMKGDGVDKISIGDTITVKGYITNYVGEEGYSTIEFNYPELITYTKNTTKAPTDPLTIVKEAYALKAGQQLPYEATLTGKITEVNTAYDVGYKNVTVTIVVAGAEDKPIKCYRLKGDGADKIGVGDTVTVKGFIEMFQHESGDTEVEYTAGCVLVKWENTGADAPVVEATKITIAEAIAKGAAMEHNTYTTEKYQITGTISEVYNTTYGNMYVTDGNGNTLTIYGTYDKDGNRYDAMTTKPIAGDTVTIEGVLGQYYDVAQIKNGIIVSHTSSGVTPPPAPEAPELPTTDGAEVSIADAIAAGAAMEHNTYTELKYKVTGEITEVYSTTYGNMRIKDADGNILTVYGTWSADGSVRYDALEVKPVAGDTVTVYGVIGQFNGTAQVKNGWIVAHTPAGTTPDPEPPVVPELPTTDGAEVSIADAIAAGAAMDANAYSELKYKVTGTITGVYNTTYGNMYITDGEGNTLTIYGTYDADGTNRYDAMTTKPVAGDTVTVYGIIGNYNGTPQMKNGWIVAHTPAGTTPDPEPPIVPELPTTDGAEVSIADAIAAGAAMDANAYSELKYKVTGTITGVYNTTYGNMYITDGEGNTLTIYGTYDADGTNRYDAMTTKPVAGDTVTVYGIIGNYNGTPQMKNGWIVAHTPADTQPEQPTETPATLSFADKANRTSFSNTQQVWEQNGITFTNDKASYNSNLGDYAAPVRIYAGTSVTIEYAGMTKIEITCNSGKPVAGLTDSLTSIPGITVSTEGNVVTIVFDAATDSFTIPSIAAQVRFDDLTVYAAAGSSEPEQPTETSATLSFADKSTRTSFSNTQQVWEQNGITFTNDKASYNSNLGDYAAPVRIYAGTSVTIEYAGMTKIEITCNSGKPVAGLTDSLTSIPGITVSTEGNVVTIEFVIAIDSFTIPSIAAQVRFDSLTVYATSASSGSQGGNTGSGSEGGNTGSGTQTPSDPITDVQYVYGSSSDYSNVIKNWGRRGFNATFLSPNAISFYADNDVTYEELAALEGTSNTDNVPSSALYLSLQEIMTTAHTTQTTYGQTRYLYCFTDCQDQDNIAGISAFYSGSKIGPAWDAGSTWNREHCWPKSKTDTPEVNNSTSGECGDLMTLRPVESSNNSSRGNKAYGVGEDFYDPNLASNSTYNLRGDVARIVLYTYVRWGNTSNMWGSEGVIESVDVLLDWIEEDPVDTWELGRNDSVESVTGTRNVFVDYPELAFVLFGEEIPAMVTPSGKAAA